MTVLADHIGGKDYRLTALVMVVALVSAVGLACFASRTSRRSIRVVAAAAAASLGFVAVRVVVKWEEVAFWVDQLTGNTGNEFRSEFLDDLVGETAGLPTAVLFLSLIAVGCAGAVGHARGTSRT